MSCLDRKIGSFPDMRFFAGDVFHCMTPTGKIFKPAFFSNFFDRRLRTKTFVQNFVINANEFNKNRK